MKDTQHNREAGEAPENPPVTKKRYHMSTSIEGLLKNMKGRKINFYTHDDGSPMSDREARQQIAELQAKGHKLIPSEGCEGFDPFEKGCPGHEIPEAERSRP